MASADLRLRVESLDGVPQGIESETLTDSITRGRNAFNRVAAPFSYRIVLFGAGPLGKGVCAGLRQAGVGPLVFADNNPKLWGAQVKDLQVLSPTDAIEEQTNFFGRRNIGCGKVTGLGIPDLCQVAKAYGLTKVAIGGQSCLRQFVREVLHMPVPPSAIPKSFRMKSGRRELHRFSAPTAHSFPSHWKIRGHSLSARSLGKIC